MAASHLLGSDGTGSYVLAAASAHGLHWTASCDLAVGGVLRCLVVRGTASGRETPGPEGPLLAPCLGCC